MDRVVRFIAVVVFSAAVLVASGALRTASTVVAQVPPPTVNLGRSCYNVIDFGADPTDNADSTPAFQAAFNAATITNGVGVCAPAGVYEITHEIVLYNGSTYGIMGAILPGGISFFGAGPGLTVLRVQATVTGNVFDSCPSFANITPTLPAPTPCPPVNPMTGAPNLNTRLSGTVFSNFSIVHPSAFATPASDFYFPEATSMLFDNVCVTGASNVFDFGDQLTQPSYGLITIRDSTCGYSFSGHFLATHGAGGGIVVSNDVLDANGTGVIFDTTDMTHSASSSAGVMTWSGNTIQQPAVGMMLFVQNGVTGQKAPGIQDSQWKGNEYDGCVFACYLFQADDLAQPGTVPDFGHITVADRSVSSLYDGVDLSGGFRTSQGVEGIQIGGPSFYSGSTGGTASSLLMLRGSMTSGDSITVTWAAGTMPPSTSFVASASITAQAAASGLAAQIATSATLPVAQAVMLANPAYGFVGLSLRSAPPLGSYNAMPYTIKITSTTLTAVGAVTDVSCSGTGSPCYDGAFDVGDGIALRNDAHDVDVVGARVISTRGAAIHVWPGSDAFHIFSNVLGQDQAATSYTGLQIENGPNPPQDYYVFGNDLVGATIGIQNLAPPPVPNPGTASFPAMRVQRGAAGYVGAHAISTPSPLKIDNTGPADCNYYFDWTSATFPMGSGILTLQLPVAGTPVTESLGTSPPPPQITIPVGGELRAVYTGTASYTGLCQP